MSSFEPEDKQKYFCTSKIGQIEKKRMQIIILELMSHFICDLTHLEAKAEIQKSFRLFFGSNEDIQKPF